MLFYKSDGGREAQYVGVIRLWQKQTWAPKMWGPRFYVSCNSFHYDHADNCVWCT